MTQINILLQKTPRQAACCPAPIDDLLDAELFKGLADPTRLALLACLAKCGRGCSVSEVAECCSVDFSVVSRHLALLERAGIVEVRKEGRTVYYTVRYAWLSQKLSTLAQALARYGSAGKLMASENCCKP